MKEQVLIAGGSGFLGAWCARALIAAGYRIKVFDCQYPAGNWFQISGIDSEKINFIQGDISNYETVLSAISDCRSVVNLAGLLTPQCSADPLSGLVVNLTGMINIFQAAKSCDIDFVVYTSSAGVFGPNHADYPEPTTHYGSYKLACEGVARAYFSEQGMSSLGLRPFVVYGPGRLTGGSAGPSVACKMAAAGQPFEIGFSGMTGFVYAGDVAAAVASALKLPVNGAHLLTMAGVTGTVSDFIAEIKQQITDAEICCTGPVLPVYGALPDYDSGGYQTRLPVTSLQTGIKKTIDFYKNAVLG